jgi:hypothetical protein
MANKPPTPGTGKGLLVRVEPSLYGQLRDWIEAHPDEECPVTFPEALRRLAEIGLVVSRTLPAVINCGPSGSTRRGSRPRAKQRERENAYGF